MAQKGEQKKSGGGGEKKKGAEKKKTARKYTQDNVTSALCITFEDDINTPANVIREEYDRAFPRWMPHVNLFFPFVEDGAFTAVTEELTKALAEVKGFNIQFDTIDTFGKGKVTFHLKPDKASTLALTSLVNKIKETLGIENSHPGPFKPHLTLGQLEKGQNLNKLDEIERSFEFPVKAKVSSLQLISRAGKSKFEVVSTIKLAE